MAKEPITTYEDSRTLSDPRKWKKFYMKIFNKDEEQYKVFVALYDLATKEGFMYPVNRAWINFRKLYEEIEEGWQQKRSVEED